MSVHQPLTEPREAVLVGLARSRACWNRMLGHGDTRGDSIILVVRREDTGGRRAEHGGRTFAASMGSMSARACRTALDLLLIRLGLFEHVTNFKVHPDNRLNLLVTFPAWCGSSALQCRSRPAGTVRRGECLFSARLTGPNERTTGTVYPSKASTRAGSMSFQVGPIASTKEDTGHQMFLQELGEDITPVTKQLQVGARASKSIHRDKRRCVEVGWKTWTLQRPYRHACQLHKLSRLEDPDGS